MTTTTLTAAQKADKAALQQTRELLAYCYQFKGPYVYGGEHDASFADDDPSDAFDCSSSVSFVLKKFKMLGAKRAQVSSWFEKWGLDGRGKYMTVHANGDHVWIEFNLPDDGHKYHGYYRFDTSPHGDGGRGPRVRRRVRSTAGFKHRHKKNM